MTSELSRIKDPPDRNDNTAHPDDNSPHSDDNTHHIDNSLPSDSGSRRPQSVVGGRLKARTKHGYLYCTHRECVANGIDHFSRGFKYQEASCESDRFVHINDWFEQYGCNPCSRTETIYLHCFRSEEPVMSTMDISTGHIVLVSTDPLRQCVL